MHQKKESAISKYNSLILNGDTTVHARFTHITRKFLGHPYTHCKSIYAEHSYSKKHNTPNNYTEYNCLEKRLLDKLCAFCNCYPSYVDSMRVTAEKNNTCRRWFCIFILFKNIIYLMFYIRSLYFENAS